MDTVRFASAAENGLLTTHLVPSCAYKNVADAPSTVSPAPSAAALSAAPFATVIFKSATSNVELDTVVVVPSTVKLPVTVIFLPTVSPLVIVRSSKVAPAASVVPTTIVVANKVPIFAVVIFAVSKRASTDFKTCMEVMFVFASKARDGCDPKALLLAY